MPVGSNRRTVLDLFQPSGENGQRTGRSLLSPFDPTSPQRPRSEGGYATSSTPAGSIESVRARSRGATSNGDRASLMSFRNFSESHLTARARDDGVREAAEEIPAVPAIVRTAPTIEAGNLVEAPEQDQAPEERKARSGLFKRTSSKSKTPTRADMRRSMDEKRTEKKSLSLRWRGKSKNSGLEDLGRLAALHNHEMHPPPSYGDEHGSSLALPVSDPRSSDSSRSDGSSDHIYGSTTTTTHTVSTHTTFFRLPRRNKNRNSLFPLPVKLPPPGADAQHLDTPATPRASMGAASTTSLQTPTDRLVHPRAMPRRHTDAASPSKSTEIAPPLPTNLFAKQSLSFAEPGLNLFRNDSQRSHASSASSPLQPPMRFSNRGRASTASSLSRDMSTPPPFPSVSGRNSTSTTGRSSLGGLLTLSRFRQSSDPHSPRHGSPGANSKSNSFAMSREALVVPEREEGDTPGRYLERLEAAVARSMIAGILSKSADPFAQAVLRSYTRRFAFFGEPIDMSLRKFLLEADLPKETQQVDRVIQAFADRYHECNPGIFIAPDQAYIIAFSLMMLHTDAFNKNNKRKMQKQDYIKNTSGQQVSDDVLGCFYDNICYTPFVHYEEEVDINGEPVLPFKTKKGKLKGVMNDSVKKPSGPLDPYNLLVEQRLDALRPAIKDFIAVDDPYNYLNPQAELDPEYLQRAFTHTGVLQIISARSRPTAYEGNLTNIPDPNDTQAGIIDLKITKVGILWRKAAKKKKARSPWQEWGAILTGSQLYLFKNAHWAKGLMHQFKEQQKPAHPRIPVVFKPPLHDFKPDALIKTDSAVALIDGSYTRHKHAFVFVRPGAQEETLLAENENELNDWLGLINYAAAFRTAGVRIRGMVGGTEEDLRSREVAVVDANGSTRSVKTIQTAHGEMSIENRGLSPQLHRQVMAARRQIMVQKIGETSTEITGAVRQLDGLLRNARHLLILAPIAPRSRDDVIHAAARADAMIKWIRRDIWRLKCHKDILGLDVQQDGITATEVQALADQSSAHDAAADAVGKKKVKGLARMDSRASAQLARSPPQSPGVAVHSARPPPSSAARPSLTVGRPSLTDSLDTQLGADVFRTPPESATVPRENEWRLPPLQLESDQAASHDPHRGSIASTLLTVSSVERATSLSHASSTSSMRHTTTADRFSSIEHHRSDTSTTSPDVLASREVEMMVRTSTQSDSGIGSLDNISPFAQPAAPSSSNSNANNTSETSRPKSGMRRSLQKTLRDAHHQGPHRHRRAKDSDATIRSATATGSAERSTGGVTDGGEDSPSQHLQKQQQEDGTPGLKREKGRFILHGKQASVVQFGNDWPNERMKIRREKWYQENEQEQQSLQSKAGAAGESPQLGSEGEYAIVDDSGSSGAAADSAERIHKPSPSTASHSPFPPRISTTSSRHNSDAYHRSSSLASSLVGESPGLREDAEYAEAYASASEHFGSPALLSSSDPNDDDEADAASSTNPKRQTVIGPGYRSIVSSSDADKGDALGLSSQGERASLARGPSIRLVDPSIASSSSCPPSREGDDQEESKSAGEGGKGQRTEEDESGVDVIDAEELRRLSRGKAVPVS